MRILIMRFCFYGLTVIEMTFVKRMTVMENGDDVPAKEHG